MELPTGDRATVRQDAEITEAARIMGRKGGQSRSPAKVRASRENGKKGGKKK